MADLADAEVQALLMLRLTEGLGPVRIEALLAHFGSARAALRASVAQLAEVPGIGTALAAQVSAARSVDVAAEVRRIEEGGVWLRVKGEADYPASLAATPQAPPLLFGRG